MKFKLQLCGKLSLMVKKRKVDRYLKVHDYWHLGIVCVFFHFDRNIAVKKSDE